MSGTITGARTGHNGLRIVIEWKVLEQDIVNNRSKVQAISYMNVAGAISYVSRNSVNINIGGNRVNKSVLSSSSSAKTRELNRHTAWVTHNSDGTKSVNISSSYNVKIMWNGKWINNISASAKVTLDSIPRASTINSASFPYALQAPKGEARENSISLSLIKKLSSYTHDIKLTHGNTLIGEWNSQSNPTSLVLNPTHVEKIFKALPNSNRGIFKLTVTTKNGSNNIGSTSVNIEARLHSNSGPYFISNTIGISGNGTDSSWGTYVQNVSKADLTSKATPGLGATLNSISITQGNAVVGSSTGSDISITSHTLTSSGNVTFNYTATDSRGNKAEETKTINVLPYVTPSVNTFSAQRNASTSTTANVSYNVSYSPVNGMNKLTIIAKYTGTSSGTIVNKVFSGTGTARATDSASYNVTNLNKLGSYDFSIEITDSLGNKSSNVYGMTSSALPLTLDKNNKGIGAGKDYERGALDVGGDAYISGVLYPEGGVEPTKVPSGDNLNNYKTPGFYFNESNTDVQNIFNTPSNYAFSLNVYRNSGVTQVFYEAPNSNYNVYARDFYNGSWSAWKKFPTIDDVTNNVNSATPTRGSNSNGEWVRFPDGTQICWGYISVERSSSFELKNRWTLPVSFANSNYKLSGMRGSGSSSAYKGYGLNFDEKTGSSVMIYLSIPTGTTSNGWNTQLDVMAIGRWK